MLNNQRNGLLQNYHTRRVPGHVSISKGSDSRTWDSPLWNSARHLALCARFWWKAPSSQKRLLSTTRTLTRMKECPTRSFWRNQVRYIIPPGLRRRYRLRKRRWFITSRVWQVQSMRDWRIFHTVILFDTVRAPSITVWGIWNNGRSA